MVTTVKHDRAAMKESDANMHSNKHASFTPSFFSTISEKCCNYACEILILRATMSTLCRVMTDIDSNSAADELDAHGTSLTHHEILLLRDIATRMHCGAWHSRKISSRWRRHLTK